MTTSDGKDVRTLYDQIEESPCDRPQKIRNLLSSITNGDAGVAINAAMYLRRLAENHPDALRPYAETIASAYFATRDSPVADSLREEIVQALTALVVNSPDVFECNDVADVFGDVLELTPGTGGFVVKDALRAWREAIAAGRDVPNDVIEACVLVIDAPRLLQAKEAAIDLLEVAVRSGETSEVAITALLTGTKDEATRIRRAAVFALARIAIECPERIVTHGLASQVSEQLQAAASEFDVSDESLGHAVESLGGE